MPAFINDQVLTYLGSLGLCTPLVNAFCWQLPTTPVDCLSIRHMGGPSHLGDPVYTPDLQILIRGTNASSTKVLMQNIYTALHDQWNILTTTGRLFSTTQPGWSDFDANNQIVFSLNFRFYTTTK